MITHATTKVIADYPCHTGEAPLWHPEHRALYWSDIPQGRLFRYFPEHDRHECCYDDRPVGGFTIQEDGALLLFRDRGNVVLWDNGGIAATIIGEIPELAGTRFNDVIADPEGRVYCGTMSGDKIKGRLHRLDRDSSLHLLLTDQGTPNGMGFSPDLDIMYYNDSRNAKTWTFEYNSETGDLRDQRLFRDAKAENDPGRPDGLTVDADGCVWTARWEGACVLRFTPGGTLDAKFDIPGVKNVSSLAFAPRYDESTGQWSDDLIDLYVTTAGGDDRQTNGDNAGALFRLRFDNDPYRGKPEYRSVVKDPAF